MLKYKYKGIILAFALLFARDAADAQTAPAVPQLPVEIPGGLPSAIPGAPQLPSALPSIPVTPSTGGGGIFDKFSDVFNNFMKQREELAEQKREDKKKEEEKAEKNKEKAAEREKLKQEIRQEMLQEQQAAKPAPAVQDPVVEEPAVVEDAAPAVPERDEQEILKLFEEDDEVPPALPEREDEVQEPVLRDDVEEEVIQEPVIREDEDQLVEEQEDQGVRDILEPLREGEQADVVDEAVQEPVIPPPPPPPPPVQGDIPPPPPPPPPVDAGNQAAVADAPKDLQELPEAQEGRGGLLDEIRKGRDLKKVEAKPENKLPEPQSGRGGLLDEIRKGKNLKKVEPAPVQEAQKEPKPDSLEDLILKRRGAIAGDEVDDSEFTDEDWE
ncbi:MAG: WH2 domain-containing protein [Alphaproteobacteria bacterium]